MFNKNNPTKNIFELIKPLDNDNLNQMNGRDLQEFLYYLDRYNLKLRDTLNLKKELTFGLEIEFDNTDYPKAKKELNSHSNLSSWIIKPDQTLNDGAEINSPILKDEISSWKELEEVCKLIENEGIICSTTGGHIHIGAHIMDKNKETWLHLLQLWSAYENIIFRFGYNDFLNGRENINLYAKPMKKKINKYLEGTSPKETNDLILSLSIQKFQAINCFHITDPTTFEEKNTIEIRSPNGTLDPVIWQNNVNFFIHFLLYTKSKNYNEETVLKRKAITKDIPNLLYREIYLDEALELADMLFKTNIDKVYFLRQYLKSFEITDKEKLVRSKKFTVRSS